MKLQDEIKAILYLCAIPLLLEGCAPQVRSVNSRGPDAYAQKRAYEAQQRRLAIHTSPSSTTIHT
jgi:hypothetical protein